MLKDLKDYLYLKLLLIKGEKSVLKNKKMIANKDTDDIIATAYGFNAEGGTKNFNFSSNDTKGMLDILLKEE